MGHRSRFDGLVMVSQISEVPENELHPVLSLLETRFPPRRAASPGPHHDAARLYCVNATRSDYIRTSASTRARRVTVGVLHDPYFTIEMTTALFFFVKVRRLLGIVRELGCVFSGVLKVRFGDTGADYSSTYRRQNISHASFRQTIFAVCRSTAVHYSSGSEHNGTNRPKQCFAGTQSVQPRFHLLPHYAHLEPSFVLRGQHIWPRLVWSGQSCMLRPATTETRIRQQAYYQTYQLRVPTRRPTLFRPWSNLNQPRSSLQTFRKRCRSSTHFFLV